MMMTVEEKEGIAGTSRGLGMEHLAASLPPPPPPPPLSQPRRLHNFSFPTLSWGGQRFLRCSKLPEGGGTASQPADQNHRTPRMKSSPGRPSPSDRERREAETRPREAEKIPSFAAVAEADRPWNLRTRRAACNAPAEEPNGNHGSACPGAPSMEKINFSVKALRRSDESEKVEMVKFSVSLSRAEIEEDFLAIKGTKPPRRPKKRVKIVQRELDSLFPGLWLSEITPDTYKIDEKCEAG
ncbi:hypothetical protein Cni_G27277 [Canna indica]|uniref:DUF1639 family protein n=1 Tax=Canna indica TaxID=4628 RepID=A0AAQ3QR86_9LILI|nr:hypothetical protein Cni_G27277 [Canna indica]